MTRMIRKIAALLTGVGLIYGQPALADDFIYKGDCARARSIMRERPLSTMIPYRKYRGSQMANYGDDSCARTSHEVYDLERTYSSSNRLEFRVKNFTYKFDKQYGDCGDPARWSWDVTGTMVVTQELRDNGGVCELYLWTDWTMRSGSDSNWNGDWANRAQVLNDFSFVITQTRASMPKYHTPLGFVGVN